MQFFKKAAQVTQATLQLESVRGMTEELFRSIERFQHQIVKAKLCEIVLDRPLVCLNFWASPLQERSLHVEILGLSAELEESIDRGNSVTPLIYKARAK